MFILCAIVNFLQLDELLFQLLSLSEAVLLKRRQSWTAGAKWGWLS